MAELEPTTTCPEIIGQIEVADGLVDVTCGAPAVVLDRSDWPSTNGFVEHETTRCNPDDGKPRHVITRRIGGLSVAEKALQDAEREIEIPGVLSPYAE